LRPDRSAEASRYEEKVADRSADGSRDRDGAVVHVLAAGKAAATMASAAARRLAARVRSGLIIAPEEVRPPDRFDAIVGGHPLPTPASEQAGRAALALASRVAPDETLLVLISGGASALMAVPADGVSLEDKRAATSQLLRAGADIYALNTVRKHLSAVKGGWLAARCRGACHGLAVSDVVGDDLSVIASGPTVADNSTFGDAVAVIKQFGGERAYPRTIVERLDRGASGQLPETPKPGDARLRRARTEIIGSRRNAMAGAIDAAAARGYHVLRLDDAVVGEARVAAHAHLRFVSARAATIGRPACIVSSGETTVHVAGRGRGGRNQEFVLAAVADSPIGGDSQAAGALTSAFDLFALASVGTDGIDGPTDAAGAMADATTALRARAAGLRADAYLRENDAYTFFDALGDLIRTGPTGTNVGDLQIILLA
jgi:hydroxypyruvate reductase